MSNNPLVAVDGEEPPNVITNAQELALLVAETNGPQTDGGRSGAFDDPKGLLFSALLGVFGRAVGTVGLSHVRGYTGISSQCEASWKLMGDIADLVLPESRAPSERN